MAFEHVLKTGILYLIVSMTVAVCGYTIPDIVHVAYVVWWFLHALFCMDILLFDNSTDLAIMVFQPEVVGTVFTAL